MRKVKLIHIVILAAACGISQTPSDIENIVGAWRLASIVGPDGKPVTAGVPAGMLIYTSDGHMSVQLMYPKSAATLSNQYVENGYEASFGIYALTPAAHTVTHHVQGSNT